MIGLLGGSFDPVHVAHLAMADAFAGALATDELRFLPAARPWQKDGLAASTADRVAMLALALSDHPAPHGIYTIDEREIARGGDTYTVDTLVELRRERGPDEPIAFLIGADQLVRLDTWRDWRRLWDHAHLGAVTRPGFDVDALPADVHDEWARRAGDAAALRATPSGRSLLLDSLALDVSATAIRTALVAAPGSASLAGLVPPGVLDYIRRRHLYGS